jgi:hypothetical protein
MVDTQKNECQKEKSTSQLESCEVNFEYHSQQSWPSQNGYAVNDSWLATITD